MRAVSAALSAIALAIVLLPVVAVELSRRAVEAAPIRTIEVQYDAETSAPVLLGPYSVPAGDHFGNLAGVGVWQCE